MQAAAIIVVDSGTHLLVPGIPGRRIRVVNYAIVCDNNNNSLQFLSGTMPLSGVMNMVQGVPLSIAAGQLFPAGAMMLFQTATSEPLNLVTTANNGVVGGHLVYVIVD